MRTLELDHKIDERMRAIQKFTLNGNDTLHDARCLPEIQSARKNCSISFCTERI